MSPESEQQALEARIQRLRGALDAVTNRFVYPESVQGSYDKRTEYMKGWNACAMRVVQILAETNLEPGDFD